MSAHSRPRPSRSRSSVRDSRDRRRRDSHLRSRSPVRRSRPARPKPISTPNVIAIVTFLARDKTWIDILNDVLRELKVMELDRDLITWRDLLEQFLLLASQLVSHSSNLEKLASSIQSLNSHHISSFISLLGRAKQQSSGKKDIIHILLRSFGKSAGNVGMADIYNRLCRPLVEKLYSCKCEDSKLANINSIGIKASGYCDLEKLVTGKSLCQQKCSPSGLSYRYHSAPATFYIGIFPDSSFEMTTNDTITITDVNGIKHLYTLDGIIYYYKPFGHLVTAVYQDNQLLQLDINGTYTPVPGGLLNRGVRTGIHYLRYKRVERDNSSTSIVSSSRNQLTSNVSPADNMSTPIAAATQHSTNLCGSKLNLVPCSADIPLHSLPPPAIIPSVSSYQAQQSQQFNSSPTAATQAVPGKRNHDNAFEDAPPSPPHPPSSSAAASSSVSITATPDDSNLDMDELDCMFGHGWRYTRSLLPPSTSSTGATSDHIDMTSVKKKRKIVNAVSSSDPSTVNTVTAATASLQTELSAPLLLGESFTTLDGGSISFDELSLEMQHYLGKHTDLTLEHQQCIVNTWLLIDKKEKQTISSDASNLLPHQPQQQQQQRIRAAASSSQSSNKECIAFDRPVPTVNSDTVIVDRSTLRVCTLNLRHVNGIAFIQYINHYLNKYPIIAFTEFSREMMDGIKMHCKSMASSGNNNNRYEIYGHGRVAMLVNCAKVELVIDVDLKQHFAGFCSGMPLAAGADIAAHKGDFANRFAVYNVKMKDGTMQSIAIAYFHSDWCANASTRIMFGKYIEYCLTRVQLHPSRMVVGDFNSVASWMDRVKNARLPTANIEDRESEDYQCLLKKYREEWEHHRESVLLPLSRAGFIDGIHLARCIQGESIDASNISFRFSYFYQLRPRSALDIIFLPPHLLSGAVIQYGPDGGIIPFLDHSPVGLHLPPPATSVGDTLGTIDIPSCYLEALPIPTIMPDIHAPADFHTVTNTFRFDINGSNLGGISMHASASRSSIQHIHPPQSVADCMFLKGITRRGKGKVRSSSFNSSRVTMQKQDRQGKQPQPQHQIQESASSSHLQKHPYTRQQQQIADNSNRDEDYHIDPSFHINKQQLPHSCPHQEQNTTSDPVPTSTAAATVTSVSQWHQQQHQHQGQHRNQNKHQHQQPHPSKPSVSIVTSLLLKGSEIAKPSVPQLPPSDFSISSASSIQQQQVQQVQRVQQVQQQYPLTDTVVDQIKASQPRKTEQQRHQIQQAQQKVQQPLPSSSLIKHVLDHHTNVCQKRDDAILGLFINQLRGLIDETHSLTRLKIVQKTLQILSTRYSTTSSVTTITTTAAATDQSSEEKLNHAIEQLRNVLPGTQSFTKCLLLQEAIDVISLLNSDATLTISAAVAILDTIPAEDGVWPPGNSYMHPKMKMYVTRWILKHEKGTYPSNEKRCALAKVAGVEVEKINSWFKNTQKQIKKRISAST